MLVVDRAAGQWRDCMFCDLPGLLGDGDVLVLNETRVIPARLAGTREATGGKVELLLIEPMDSPGTWLSWMRAGGKLRPGEWIEIAPGELRAQVIERRGEAGDVVVFEPADGLEAAIERHGRMPVPPYIARDGDEMADVDRERYQTVYAKQPGAVAAPTAGLHFTEAVFEAIRQRNVDIQRLVLHVGPGTFRPVKEDDIERHAMHPERYSIPAATADAVNRARRDERRVVAVGTTVTRALEASAAGTSRVAEGESSTDIFIHPGFDFQMVDALLTNFHLPKSTLLMLVSALATRELILAAYEHAVKEEYRFYSYGDAMLII